MKRSTVFVCIFTGIACFSSWYFWYWEYRSHGLEVYFFTESSGIGSPGVSILVRTTKNKIILINGGKTNAILRKLTLVMPFYKRKIDTVIISDHYDNHITGLVSVLERYHIGQIIEPSFTTSTSSSYTQLKGIISQKNILDVYAKAGDVFDIGIKMSTLFPCSDFKFIKTNNRNLFFSLEDIASSFRFLFAENLSKTEQKYLVDRERLLSVKGSTENSLKHIFLVFSHAGNTNVINNDFLEYIRPTLIFYSKKPQLKGLSPIFTSSSLNLAERGDTSFLFDEDGYIQRLI